MTVTVHTDTARAASTPGDLVGVGAGAVVLIAGEPADGREAALWAPALGQAVMRGAEIRRRTS